jgi:hypothetical protein
MNTPIGKIGLMLVLVIILLNGSVLAQDLEPRSQAGAPVGVNILILGYSYSDGNILLDQSLPIEGAEAKINALVMGYATTLNIFGRLAKFDVIVPFSHGTWRGLLDGEPASTTRTGFGDPRVRLGINFTGVPALFGKDFVKFHEKFVAGASLQVRIPLGQYNGDKLVNLGTNRWVFKPNLGAAINLGRWIIEGAVSVWIFTANPDFYGHNILTQKPLYAVQLHLAYRFKRGLWAALSLGRSWGGKTTVNDLARDDSQNNSILGLTLALPLYRKHALVLAFKSGITTRYGADFDTVALAYQYRWMKST